MAVREILHLGDERLRQECREIPDPTAREVRRLVEDLRDTVEHSFRTTGYGRGIAASQLGEMVRVVFLSARVTGSELVMVNPKVTWRSPETVQVWDSCLCFLSIFMKVERHKMIVVEYFDLEGVKHTLEAGEERDLSELLQHELDHLDGVLCLDRISNVEGLVSREFFEQEYRKDSPYAKCAA